MREAGNVSPPTWRVRDGGKCFPVALMGSVTATGKHLGNVSPSLRQSDGETFPHRSDEEMDAIQERYRKEAPFDLFASVEGMELSL